MGKNNAQMDEDMTVIEENMEDAAVETVEDELAEKADAAPEAEGEGLDEQAADQPAEEDDVELVMTLDDVRLVEAMLFASATALTESQIAERFTPGRAKLIPDALEHLREHYANRGVNLVQRDRRWALRTATDLADQLRLEKEQPKKFRSHHKFRQSITNTLKKTI
jgi:hypothetical protein